MMVGWRRPCRPASVSRQGSQSWRLGWKAVSSQTRARGKGEAGECVRREFSSGGDSSFLIRSAGYGLEGPREACWGLAGGPLCGLHTGVGLRLRTYLISIALCTAYGSPRHAVATLCPAEPLVRVIFHCRPSASPPSCLIKMQPRLVAPTVATTPPRRRPGPRPHPCSQFSE